MLAVTGKSEYQLVSASRETRLGKRLDAGARNGEASLDAGFERESKSVWPMAGFEEFDAGLSRLAPCYLEFDRFAVFQPILGSHFDWCEQVLSTLARRRAARTLFACELRVRAGWEISFKGREWGIRDRRERRS